MRSISPSTMHPPFGNYAHGALIPGGAELLVTSGQLAISREGDIPETAADQAALIFENISETLAQGKMERRDVFRIAGFVTDRAYFEPYMAARDRWLDGTLISPASTLVIVSGFTRPEFLVEIEVWAAR
ncbi:MAG: RidA family protein [Pseudomonadota bacterium]